MNKYQFPISNFKFQITASLLFIVLLLLTSHFSLPTSAYAEQTASPSAGLLEKINTLKKEIASKAADLKNEVSRKLQNKAYSGFISQISDSTINLGNGKNVLVNEYTQYKSKVKNQKLKLTVKDFSVNDYIVALGDVDDKKQLKAKLLIKSQPLATDSSKLTWGQVVSAYGGEIVIKNRENKNQTIQTFGLTNYFLGSDEASFLDAKEGRFLVAKGQMRGEVLIARFVYYIPSAGFIKPEKKSATASATPSASPKK